VIRERRRDVNAIAGLLIVAFGLAAVRGALRAPVLATVLRVWNRRSPNEAWTWMWTITPATPVRSLLQAREGQASAMALAPK
jgi:hypothetical protein